MGRALRFATPFLVLLAACAPEGPSGFVTFNVPPSSDCVYSPASGGDTFISTGRYDIAPRAGDVGEACLQPYNLHLQINSFLRSNSDEALGRAEPNILQLHSAEVKLMNLQRQTIFFDRFDDILPNPFLVTTNNSIFTSDGQSPATGIAAVEAIPAAYAPQLDAFDGMQILAEVQIFGTTTGDVDIDFKPFVYPIEICEGCLTVCAGDLDTTVSLDEIFGDNCPDNAGADGRFCIDTGC